MSAFQGSIREEVVFLTDGIGPITGLLPVDMTARIRKPEGEFEDKALDSDNFMELESGLYLVIFSETDMQTLGTFTYSLNSGSIDYTWNSFQIVPLPLQATVGATSCIVTGNIINLGGKPGVNTKIQFRLGQIPSVFLDGQSLVSADILTTFPDAMGNFSVSLLRGETVIVEIPQTGIVQQIIIPNQETADLTDLLPPIE